MHFHHASHLSREKNEGSLPFRRGFLVFRPRPAAVTRLGLFVIPLVKPYGIYFVLIRRDKALIISTIYSLTHFFCLF